MLERAREQERALMRARMDSGQGLSRVVGGPGLGCV